MEALLLKGIETKWRLMADLGVGTQELARAQSLDRLMVRVFTQLSLPNPDRLSDTVWPL